MCIEHIRRQAAASVGHPDAVVVAAVAAMPTVRARASLGVALWAASTGLCCLWQAFFAALFNKGRALTPGAPCPLFGGHAQVLDGWVAPAALR